MSMKREAESRKLFNTEEYLYVLHFCCGFGNPYFIDNRQPAPGKNLAAFQP